MFYSKLKKSRFLIVRRPEPVTQNPALLGATGQLVQWLVDLVQEAEIFLNLQEQNSKWFMILKQNHAQLGTVLNIRNANIKDFFKSFDNRIFGFASLAFTTPIKGLSLEFLVYLQYNLWW